MGEEPIPVLPGVAIQSFSVQEFAESTVEFYKALLTLGIKENFAEELTIAFVRRP